MLQEQRLFAWLPPGRRAIHLMALAGLGVFYGLERLAARSRSQRAAGSADRTGGPAFAVHIGSFALRYDRTGPGGRRPCASRFRRRAGPLLYGAILMAV